MTSPQKSLPPVEALVDLVGNCSVGVSVTDSDGRFLDVNNAQVEMMGGERASLGDGLLVDDQPDQLPDLMRRLRGEGALNTVSVGYRLPDGRIQRGLLDAAWVGGATDGRGYWVCPDHRPELERDTTRAFSWPS